MRSESQGEDDPVPADWSTLVKSSSVRDIMADTGLAQIGDNLVNLCFSVAKSLVTGRMVGEKVSDKVLARAIRATPLYQHVGHRTDAGTAGDAYEAIVGYLWLTGRTTVGEIVEIIARHLHIDEKMNRRQQAGAAAEALRRLVETLSERL